MAQIKRILLGRWRRTRDRTKFLLLLGAVPFLSSCRIIAGAFALVGVGVVLVGVGTYQAVRLTGRAASNAASATGHAITSAGEGVAMRAGAAKDATGRATYKVGTSIFSGGDHSFALPYEVYVVWNASYRALDAMKFTGIDSQYDALSGWLKASTVQGKEVNIALKREPSAQTLVTIRVGVRGDEDASRVIEDWIVYYLGYTEAEPGISS